MKKCMQHIDYKAIFILPVVSFCFAHFYSLQKKDDKNVHHKINKTLTNSMFMRVLIFVPKTGFEPAHPCECYDLNIVRLPISPLGQVDCKYNSNHITNKLQPRISLLSKRPCTSKLPSSYTMPTSSVAIKEQL